MEPKEGPTTHHELNVMATSSIPEVIEDLRAGKMIILVDDPGRENEGDLAMLAEHVTPEAINFMVREGRGLVGRGVLVAPASRETFEADRQKCRCID